MQTINNEGATFQKAFYPLDDADVRLRHAEMLLNISRQMAAHESLDDMLRALIEIVTESISAERATIFLKDKDSNELYARVARGNFKHELRIPQDIGVAGHVFISGQPANVKDAYNDPHFDSSVDEETGFTTRTILCVPIRTVKDEVIGVAQALNKGGDGPFDEHDLDLFEAIMSQASIALQAAQIVENVERARKREMELLDIITDITSEIELGAILTKVMDQATKMLDSERSTLFLNDERSNELFSQIGQGLGAVQIRLPNDKGIAGAVFTSGETINIPYAYADLRFNPAFDKKTGFFTRSVLCVPVTNKKGKTIGVIQLLNKRRGAFTEEDESKLKTFTAQVSIALENAKLFDETQNMKNFNESMLQSMSNGVITIIDGEIITCNKAALKILNLTHLDEIVKHKAEAFFTDDREWVMEKVKQVESTQDSVEIREADLACGGEVKSVNVTVLPFSSVERDEQRKSGSMIMIEDISSEKRIKSTMSRYMDPDVAEQLLKGGEDILGGKSTVSTVLFSDIRGFTTLTEELGAAGTVSLLNEYFTIMVECIQKQGGMLDKFIGDAIMAGFGLPIAHDDDEDRAVRSAISMINELWKWNNQRISHGKKPIDMGIGINTGLIVTGNIGSPKRMDYTMIGDGVNIASRLESACKQYFARILISDNTYKKLRGTYRVREVDKVVVKGKTEPVAIYEVMDYHNEETFPYLMEIMNLFKSGLVNYREGNWRRAKDSFEEALRLNPQDNLTRMYIGRCEYLMENPPEEEWKGVWIMKEK